MGKKNRRKKNKRIPNMPPHFDTPVKGQCRWCGGMILREDGSVNKRKRWHKECVLQYFLCTDPSYTRQVVFSRDKGYCQKCGQQTNNWEVDHIKRLAESGGDISFWMLDNIQTLCESCHKTKTAYENSRHK